MKLCYGDLLLYRADNSIEFFNTAALLRDCGGNGIARLGDFRRKFSQNARCVALEFCKSTG
jgi:hypothetical protein